MAIPYVFNRMATGNVDISVLPVEGECGVFVYNRNNAIVSSGFSISGIALTYYGNKRMAIWSAGSADSTTVNASGSMSISSGGRATNVVINSSGYVYVYSAGVVSGAEIKSSGIMSMMVGANASGITVSMGGYLNNSGSATAIVGLQMQSGCGGVSARESSYIANVEMQSGCGGVTLSSGASGDNFDIQSNTCVYVLDGAAISSATLSSGGSLRVSLGGQAHNVTHHSGGILYAGVYGGDMDTVIDGSNAYGEFSLSGGTASNFAVYGGMCLNVSYGGVTENAQIHPGCSCVIYGGGSAIGTVISSGGSLSLQSASVNRDRKSVV